MELPYYLISDPPQPNMEVDSDLASHLCCTVAEAKILLNYPAPVIWLQRQNKDELIETSACLAKMGIQTIVVNADSIFQFKDPVKASNFDLEDDKLIFKSSDETIIFDINKPLLLVEHRLKEFGSEYKKFKERERSKKDRRKRGKQEGSQSMLMGQSEQENLDALNRKSALRWFLAQKDNETIVQVEISPSEINFDILGARKQINLEDNLKELRALLSNSCKALDPRPGLIDISYRYPLMQNPSFIEVMNRHEVNKNSFPPISLARQLNLLGFLQKEVVEDC